MKRFCISAAAAGLLLPSWPSAEEGWYGFYAAGPVSAPETQLGFHGLSMATVAAPDMLRAGYNHDIAGAFVLGGEVNLDEPTIADVQLNKDLTTKRLKARLGYDLGPMLIYGVLGYAEISTGGGFEDGYTYDLGVKYKLNDAFLLSAEMAQDFQSFRSISPNSSALNFKVSYRF
ncbi:outer membrane beta-barrel protein [Rhodobacteraceae bacterium F11138]|nr:outer membrane beta-barrel protein [Rhodobacteraceae bacterium F11138]